MSERPAYDSSSLDGMSIDIYYALEHKGFRLVEHEGFRLARYITKTGDSQVMLKAICRPETVPVSEARTALERAWLERAALQREAHVVDEDEWQILLDFVSWGQDPGGHYVTGRIVVDLSHPAG